MYLIMFFHFNFFFFPSNVSDGNLSYSFIIYINEFRKSLLSCLPSVWAEKGASPLTLCVLSFVGDQVWFEPGSCSLPPSLQ